MKNDTQNQRYDQIKQFYDSCTVSDGSFEDLHFSQDAESVVMRMMKLRLRKEEMLN